MKVGFEWLIDAAECDAESLRDVEKLRAVFAKVISDLDLKTIGQANWHKFPGAGGVTGLVMLTESHLACHTYPEHNSATFNLYCCRERPEWDWEANLREIIGAGSVKVTIIERGANRSAAVPAAVPQASRLQFGFPKVSFGEIEIRERGYLPHWEKEGGVYFVTFRLGDSLPKDLLDKLQQERDLSLKALESLNRDLSPTEKRKIDFLFSERLNEYLDKGYGSCILRRDDIAKLVADSLLFFDGDRYRLFAWCVMPNHVHVIFRPQKNYELSDIVHSWKSYTAKEANKILGKEGEFWQREYYDHLIRDDSEFYKTIDYVLDNPGSAGLIDWKWVGDSVSARRTHNSRQDAGATLAAGGEA